MDSAPAVDADAGCGDTVPRLRAAAAVTAFFALLLPAAAASAPALRGWEPVVLLAGDGDRVRAVGHLRRLSRVSELRLRHTDMDAAKRWGEAFASLRWWRGGYSHSFIRTQSMTRCDVTHHTGRGPTVILATPSIPGRSPAAPEGSSPSATYTFCSRRCCVVGKTRAIRNG